VAARRANSDTRWYDWLDVPFAGDTLSGFVASILLIVTIALLVLFGIPALLALVDLVIVLLATLIGVLSRLLFRRPWTVEALATNGERHQEQVVGWRASGEAVSALARRIEFGPPLAPSPADRGVEIARQRQPPR
jgi:purine-cytosine permease-like protein